MTLAIQAESDSVLLGSRGSHRWSLAEYYKLGDSGLFRDKRTELIRGVFYVMPLPDEPHSNRVIAIGERLRDVYGREFVIREEKGFVVPPDTDCAPDLAIVGRADMSATVKPRTALLVAEVAFTTLSYDLDEKADLYAAAGVALYLTVAPTRRAIYVHTEPRPVAVSATGYRYASVVKLDVGQSVTLNDPTGTAVPVAELLGVTSPA